MLKNNLSPICKKLFKIFIKINFIKVGCDF